MQVLLSLSFLILTGTVISQLQSSSKPDDIVREFFRIVELITAKSSNPIERLKNIREHGPELLKLSVPIGNFLIASIIDEDTFLPASENYVVMTKLHERLAALLYRLFEQADYRFVERKDQKFTMTEFKFTFSYLDNQIESLTYPDKMRSPLAERNASYYVRNSEDILEISKYMKHTITEKCELNNTLVFAKLENIWLQFEQKFGVSTLEKWQETEIEKVLFSFSSYESMQIIDLIERISPVFTTFNSALTEIYNMIKHLKSDDPTVCFTDAVFDGSMYRRYYISPFTNTIQAHLSRLLISATVHGKFLFPNNSTALEKFQQTLLADVVDTATFLIDYIPKKLNMSSSGVEAVFVKKTIRDFPWTGNGIIASSEFYNLRQRIRLELGDIGPENIEKQVYVVSSETKDPNFTSPNACPEYWCTKVLEKRGVNVMIKRSLKNGSTLSHSTDNVLSEI